MNTTHTDMCGISPFHLLPRTSEEVASVYFFPKFPIRFFFLTGLSMHEKNEERPRFFLWLEHLWLVAHWLAAPSKSKNSTVIKQSNISRGTLLIARLLWSILVSSSNLVRLITRQQNITLQSVWDVTDQH